MSGLYVDGGNNSGPSGTSNVSPDGVADNIVTTASVTSATTVVTGDMTGYSGGSFQITNAGTSNIISFEQSNDGVNWLPLLVVVNSSLASGATTAIAVAGVYAFAASAAQVRARVSTYTSGTVTISLVRKRAAPVVSNVALSFGTQAIGDVGAQYRTNATGAATPFSLLSPATPAATAVKAGAGRVVGAILTNSAAAVRSVKFFNTAQGSVTLGTTSAVFELDIPAGQMVMFNQEGGISFSTAITVAVTGAKGLTDNTGALGANDVSGVILYA